MNQVTIFDYMMELKQRSFRQRYPIPPLPQKYLTEEGWWDSWHYTDEEKPTESNVYYTIHDFHDCYMYSYFYYSAESDKWYEADTWFKKWVEALIQPFAWVGIPSKYMSVDRGLQERFEYAIKEKLHDNMASKQVPK